MFQTKILSLAEHFNCKSYAQVIKDLYKRATINCESDTEIVKYCLIEKLHKPESS